MDRKEGWKTLKKARMSEANMGLGNKALTAVCEWFLPQRRVVPFRFTRVETPCAISKRGFSTVICGHAIAAAESTGEDLLGGL